MEQDQEDRDDGAIVDMWFIIFLVIGASSFWAGYFYADSRLAKSDAVIDCRPPRTEYDKVIATLKPRGGILSLDCHSETIIPFGGSR